MFDFSIAIPAHDRGENGPKWMKELLDSLFPLTYSCEGSIEATKHHTQHCKKCWWCQERYWAFGRYV